MKETLKLLLSNFSRYHRDRWLFNQQIPFYSVPRTLIDYDIEYFGDDEFFAPDDQLQQIRLKHPEFRIPCSPQVMPRPYYFCIVNGLVYRDYILDPARPRCYISETQPEFSRFMEGANFSEIAKNQSILSREALKGKPPDLESAFLFSTKWWSNYYHFLTDCCLRYVELKRHGIISSETTILLQNAPNRWQRDLLELIGVSERNMVLTDARPLSVERLIVGAPRRNRFMVSKPAVDALRDVLPIGDGVGDRRLYVSRSLASVRRVSNAAEVEALLTSYDFEVVHAEKLNVQEQVTLFSQAGVIAGPHGAGLTNMIFSQGATVIEMFPRAYWLWGFFILLANASGARYTPIIGETANCQDDMVIDVEELEQAISSAVS